MKVTDADLRQALGHRRSQGGSDREGCPSADAIVAHAEGSGACAEDEVLEHVSRCASCALEYRLALSLKPWAAGAASTLRASPPAGAPLRPRTAWLPQALAASLLVSVGLTAWSLALRGQRFELQARLAEAEGRAASARHPAQDGAAPPATALGAVLPPGAAVNVPIVDLDAGGSRGPGEAPAVVRVPAGASMLAFVLTVSGGAGPGAHHVQIRADDTRLVWEGGGLVANPFGTFTLAVPGALLPAGRYDVVLSRPAPDGTMRRVQSYRLVVQPPTP